jgi:hypothetical protein
MAESSHFVVGDVRATDKTRQKSLPLNLSSAMYGTADKISWPC